MHQRQKEVERVKVRELARVAFLERVLIYQNDVILYDGFVEQLFKTALTEKFISYVSAEDGKLNIFIKND